MDSAQAGQVISIDGPEMRVGRHRENGLVIDDEGLSRVHARVFLEDGAYVVEDLGSSNGTYVDGERIERHGLLEGAVVQFGPRVCLRFSLTDELQEGVLKKLYESSVKDPLTGAYNRHFFGERLASEMAYAERHNTEVSALVFDVDHFKRVNDTFGHPVGDLVLQKVCAVTQQLLREEDLLARYGGEEFIVLLRGVSLPGATRAAERLRVAIEKASVDAGGNPLSVTVSIGCASLACADRMDPETLIGVADRRLYLAKRAGRNCVMGEG
jgi:diguanylate cyclase (GGDEF)-like protein